VRIVHAADSFPPDVGGIETQVAALSRHQRAQGHEVTVITAVHEHADLDLPVVRAKSGRWLTVAFPWRNYRMVAEVLDGPRVDVVHAHFTVISPLGIYVARAASRRGIPVAITVHSLWWQVATATRLCMVPFGWGRIRAAWSGVSRVAAGHVRRTLPGVGEVSVVPNLVDTQWWQPVAPIRETGAGEIRLALVGRLKKRKHVNEFIEVLARVRPRVAPDVTVKVDIVGDGPRRDDLQRMVDRLGLSDWVTFLGHRPPAGVRTFLHQSDLFIAPCRQESFGIAALEARAAGLPVVGYRGSGLTEFITDGVDGALVGDEDEMVEALVTLLGRPDELERLRKTTTTTPPSITVHDTVSAVEAVYRRARTVTP
jgi:glycosyltransferase involved in cell wall biosynthesis